MTISPSPTSTSISAADFEILRQLEKKVLWLSSWMIHNANHLRDNRDGLKVGGHQASCASAATVMTALWFAILRPQDRVAVKPHASPVFHAIQYLLGHQSLRTCRNSEHSEAHRPIRRAQKTRVLLTSRPVPSALALARRCLPPWFRTIFMHIICPADQKLGRMIALMGDAELDEGNVFEALLEGWKHDVQNLWWVIDYNRQSLDGVINDNLFQKITQFFETVGWRVVNLKYGKKLQAAFNGPAGGALKHWIDNCPNQLYSALTYKRDGWREHLRGDLRGSVGFSAFLDSYSDEDLHALMTNLGGHDLEYLVENFAGVDDGTPRCFIAYTIKGHGLPIVGHKDNHAGLMNADQISAFRQASGIREARVGTI